MWKSSDIKRGWGAHETIELLDTWLWPVFDRDVLKAQLLEKPTDKHKMVLIFYNQDSYGYVFN